MKIFFQKIGLLVLNILFPLKCLGCKKPKALLCAECFDKIPLNQTLFCPVCHRRLAQNKKVCHQDSLYLLAAAGSYENPILRELILTLKYKRYQPAAKILAEILNRYLETANLDLEKYQIIPIPLHKNRRQERGFNQAELIANALIALNSNLGKSDFPRLDFLKKVKDNQPQTQIKNWEKRRTNIKGGFQAANSENIKGENIILLDDVSTSGATLEEAAGVLKKAGAKKIIGLVVAKR